MIAPRSLVRQRWGWLFPAAFAAHAMEEVAMDLPGWLSSHLGRSISPHDFLILSTIFVAFSAGGVILAWEVGGARWVLSSFGTVLLVAASIHVAEAAATGGYSPGLGTALAALPLGTFALFRMRRLLRPVTFIFSIFFGMLLYAIATTLVMAA
ncbi:MAG: HXXEE domain-containing protein [Thermoanaerobaculia bacterium]